MKRTCDECGYLYNTHAYRDLLASLEIAREALNRIAAWDEGPEVKGSFDEPGAARVARESLARVGRSA